MLDAGQPKRLTDEALHRPAAGAGVVVEAVAGSVADGSQQMLQSLIGIVRWCSPEDSPVW